MPRFIVKPDRDTDAYVIWSTIVDCPASTLGTRAETEAYLKRCNEWGDGKRLDRADATGTSGMADAAGWFGWDDDTFIVRECIPRDGELKRSDLLAFCRAHDREDQAEMLRLTTEIEDDA